jgi:hypothetical protein
MSSMNQGHWWDSGDMLDWGKAPGRAETSAPWTPSLWKTSPLHYTLKGQVGHHTHANSICWPSRLPPHRPTRQLLTACPASPWDSQAASQSGFHLPPCRPTRSPPTGLPGHCPPTGPQAHQQPPTTGGLQHHQILALNLPRTHRQTGLDAKGVTTDY